LVKQQQKWTMPKLLHEIITEAAAHCPDAPALQQKNKRLTYRQLEQLIDQKSQALLALHLQARQRVGVYLPKQQETVSSFFAISRAGGVFVPINPVLKAPQVSHILQDCDVQILITAKNRLQGLADVLEGCPALHSIILVDADIPELPASVAQKLFTWQDFLAAARQRLPLPPGIDADMAAILYTSGSTGKPKGVVLCHRNIIEGGKSVNQYLEITAKDRILAVLPFSFDYGLNQLISAMLAGCCCVLLDYLLPGDVIKSLVKHKITGLAAVPPLWAQLAQLDWPQDINEHLRYMTNSGGKMPKKILHALREKVPACRFFLMYGLTEAFRSTYLPPEQLDLRPDSMGKAIPNAEVLVVREDGSPCAPHEPGELVHRGTLVAMGYWNDPVKTAERFKPAPGQFKELPITEIAVWSGDTVSQDEEGFLYFVGRQDDMIKTSGYRVSPTEIEEVLYASGIVKEAAAIGIPHETLGQAIVVIIVPEEHGFDLQSLLNICKSQLPNFMVPHNIEALSSLPKNPNGKINRKALEQQFANIFQP